MMVGLMYFQRSRTPGRCRGCLARGEVFTVWPLGAALLENSSDDLLVGEAQDVIEVLAGVVRIAARVGAAQDRHAAALPEHVAERVRELTRLGERPHEEQVEISRDLLEQVLEARVADEGDVVSCLLTPRGDRLRHDARETGMHHASPQGARRRLGDQIEDRDSQLSHGDSVLGESVDVADLGAMRRGGELGQSSYDGRTFTANRSPRTRRCATAHPDLLPPENRLPAERPLPIVEGK